MPPLLPPLPPPLLQAYRDWGVQLFDWQSQSSVLADGSGCAATHRRMMPSVGCEADAIAFTSQAQQLFGVPAPGGPQPPVAPDGSYVSGPADISAPDCAKAAFEACLALGCGGDGAATQQPRRLRVVHNLQRVGSEGRWALDSVELHHERLDSTYRGKVELSGCGGGMKTFASADRLGADALAGAWVAAGLRYTADPAGNGCRADAVSSEAWSADTQPALLLHPLGAWSSCAIADGADGDISLAAGVLLGDSMVVATQRLVGGRLAAAELLTLQRA